QPSPLSRMLPPPPRTPLFPYTTLFRSGGCTSQTCPLLQAWQGTKRVFHREPGRDVCRQGSDNCATRSPRRRSRGGCWLGAERREDRKSTRLNSSHVASSYAGFCLKKKR